MDTLKMFVKKREARRKIGYLKGVIREHPEIIDINRLDGVLDLFEAASKVKDDFNFYEILRDNYANITDKCDVTVEEAEMEIAYMAYIMQVA